MPGEDIILSQSEYEALLEEIRNLQVRISKLTAIRDAKHEPGWFAVRVLFEKILDELNRT